VEGVEECAARELLEETGLVALPLRLGPYTSDFISPHRYTTFFVFITKFSGGEAKTLESHKCEGWKWPHWNELPTPLFFPLQTFVREFGHEKFVRF